MSTVIGAATFRRHTLQPSPAAERTARAGFRRGRCITCTAF
jgi:hypothetical protein